MRITKIAISAAIFGSLLLGGAPAYAAAPSTPAGGSVRFFVMPNGTGGGPIVITGAIGDYGHTLDINKNGTPDPNSGHYVKITLQRGTFEVNKTALDAKSSKVQPAFDLSTCSAAITATAPITLFDGTGLYAGIAGTLTATVIDGFILPRLTSGKSKGQCNESNNAQPVSEYAVVTGTGTVSFTVM